MNYAHQGKVIGAGTARPRDAWDHLNLLSDIALLPDGRVEATASYVDGSGLPSDRTERNRFVRIDGVWQIDDSTPLCPDTQSILRYP